MREKLIDERLDLADAICYAMRDWDDYMDKCRETETPPIDSFEDFIADGVLSAGYRKQKWIPVTERLPDKMGKYICRYVFGENTDYPFEQVLYYYTAVEKPHFQNEGSLGLRVTHWMPLPDPPEGE